MSDPLAGPRALLAAYDTATRTGYPTALREAEMPKALRTALAEVGRLTADLSALRLEHEAVCGLLAHTRRDRDEARARIAELGSRPGYDAAVRVCARIVERSVVPENAHRSILALLEPKP